MNTETSTIQSEHRMAPYHTGVVQRENEARTQAEVRRTTEHYHSVVALHKQTRPSILLSLT